MGSGNAIPGISSFPGVAIFDPGQGYLSVYEEGVLVKRVGGFNVVGDNATATYDSGNGWVVLTIGAGVGQRAGLIYQIDGAGSVITTGLKYGFRVPFACTIKGVTLGGAPSGSIVVDIWKDTHANFPPLDADSITASAVPTITTDTDSEDTTLTSWTTSIDAGDWLYFNVDSVTTMEFVSVNLDVERA